MLDLLPPFAAEDELFDSNEIAAIPPLQQVPRLPGNPKLHIQADNWTTTFLFGDLVATDLEKFAPKLWMMSRQDNANISPLHRQMVKGRRIVITEEPKLHLVWFYDRVFIKPLPRYLLCHAFWKNFLLPDGILFAGEDRLLVLRSALGLLRTYHHLIQHESDFRIAQSEDLQLIPRDVTWQRYCAFSKQFRTIGDHEVTKRYHYGEIRLTRLNFCARFILDRSQFISMTPQYADFFGKFYAPLLFAFAIFSLILNGMQVALTAETQTPTRYHVFDSTCRAFGILAIFLTILTSLVLAIIWALKFIREWNFAIRDLRTKRAQKTQP